MGDRAEDLTGDFEEAFRGEEEEEEGNLLLYSLVSGSVFFLGEDLVKRPISIEWCRVDAQGSGGSSGGTWEEGFRAQADPYSS